jgi:DNA-binding IclR family transcriptional regulator
MTGKISTAQPDAPSSGLERWLLISRLLASYDTRGLSVSEMASRTKLPMTTVHRLVGEMVRLRLATRLACRKRYVLGAMTFELGLAASNLYDLRNGAMRLLQTLSESTGMPAYFFGRSGTESVCLGFQEPRQHDSTVTLKLGGRRPLGIGAAGLAILAKLSDLEVDRVLECHRDDWGKYGGMTANRVCELVAETRRLGYAASGGCIHHNTAAVGVAIMDPQMRIRGAVSVSSTVARLRRAESNQLAGLINNTLKASGLVQLLSHAELDVL